MDCIAGIDVSKDHVDVWISADATARRFATDAAGLVNLVGHLQHAQVVRVVLEATGGYERRVMLQLTEQGFLVNRINPRRMRRFAQAAGYLAKTDAIDARVIAEYGRVMMPPARELPNAERVALLERLARREQIVGMIAAERKRLAQMLDDEAKNSVLVILAVLKEQLKKIEASLDSAIARDKKLAAQARILGEEPGVGDTMIRTLLIALPELGQVSRQQIAALVGVAPLNQDSGKKRGKRSIGGGRATVRRVLYMATLVATRHHTKIRACYEHLQARGKCKKLALVACMRKLLTILNAKIRNHLNESQRSPGGPAAVAPS